jgi:predicted ester cyclase
MLESHVEHNVERNKDVVRAWIDEIFNAHRTECIGDLKVASYLDWTPMPAQRMDLPVSGIKQSFPKFLKSLPDFRFDADVMYGEGDLVVSVGRWQATHSGEELLGMAPSGARVGGTRIDMFRVAGDKMIEHWGCGNELRFLEMTGGLKAAAAAPREDSPKEIARGYVEEVIGRRDLAAINRFVGIGAVDHNYHSVTMGLVLAAFPDYAVEVEEVMAEDGKTAVVSGYRGTHRGMFMGVPATGREVSGRRIDVFRIGDGRIVESWHDWDVSNLQAQIQG